MTYPRPHRPKTAVAAEPQIGYSYAGAAALLGCSTPTIKRLVRAGRLRAIRVTPRMTRIPRTDLEQLFK